MFFKGENFSFPLKKRTYIMGILNVTPDSFSDGGEYAETETALDRAAVMARQGADIIDIGACSTAPSAEKIDSATEIRRLERILPKLTKTLNIPISVDTFYPETAEYALSCSAAIINDVSGVFNEDIARLIKKHNAGWIITHGGDSAKETVTSDIIREVNSFFAHMVEKAELFGINREQLCFDVGIGFGKSRENDFDLVRFADKVDSCSCALMYGASRKRLIEYLTGEEEPKLRMAGTLAAHIAAATGGADFIRVHDVFEAVQSMKVTDAIIYGKR